MGPVKSTDRQKEEQPVFSKNIKHINVFFVYFLYKNNAQSTWTDSI